MLFVLGEVFLDFKILICLSKVWFCSLSCFVLCCFFIVKLFVIWMVWWRLFFKSLDFWSFFLVLLLIVLSWEIILFVCWSCLLDFLSKVCSVLIFFKWFFNFEVVFFCKFFCECFFLRFIVEFFCLSKYCFSDFILFCRCSFFL